MIDLKKINQIRSFSEGISIKPRTASRISIGAGGADQSVEKDTLDNVPYTAKTEKDKRIKAALDKMGQQFKMKESKHTGEGDMAKSQLRSIISNAQEVHDMLKDDDDMSEWVQNKITLSADYISTVREYLKNEVNEGSVGYHSKRAQSAKGISTKHKHLALAMKAKSKFKPPALGTNMVVPANEEAEPIDEISKDLAKSYLDKTVDPVYGMPKHGMKDRMKGIRQASIRVLKKAGKPKTN